MNSELSRTWIGSKLASQGGINGQVRHKVGAKEAEAEAETRVATACM